jgi:hypothetical protein
MAKSRLVLKQMQRNAMNLSHFPFLSAEIQGLPGQTQEWVNLKITGRNVELGKGAQQLDLGGDHAYLLFGFPQGGVGNMKVGRLYFSAREGYLPSVHTIIGRSFDEEQVGRLAPVFHQGQHCGLTGAFMRRGTLPGTATGGEPRAHLRTRKRLLYGLAQLARNGGKIHGAKVLNFYPSPAYG